MKKPYSDLEHICSDILSGWLQRQPLCWKCLYCGSTCSSRKTNVMAHDLLKHNHRCPVLLANDLNEESK
jgi:hypothetical protein